MATFYHIRFSQTTQSLNPFRLMVKRNSAPSYCRTSLKYGFGCASRLRVQGSETPMLFISTSLHVLRMFLLALFLPQVENGFLYLNLMAEHSHHRSPMSTFTSLGSGPGPAFRRSSSRFICRSRSRCARLISSYVLIGRPRNSSNLFRMARYSSSGIFLTIQA